MKPSSQPPQSGAERPDIVTIDRFISETLTAQERAILPEYLYILDSTIFGNLVALRQTYGDVVINELAYKVQGLVETCGGASDPVRRALFDRLEVYDSVRFKAACEDAPGQNGDVESVRQSVGEVVCPFAKTVCSSNPPAPETAETSSDPRVLLEKLLVALTEDEKRMLMEDVFVKSTADRASKMRPVSTVTARIMASLLESGAEPSFEVIQVLIAEKLGIPMADKNGTTGFVRLRERITLSPWTALVAPEKEQGLRAFLDEFLSSLSDEEKRAFQEEVFSETPPSEDVVAGKRSAYLSFLLSALDKGLKPARIVIQGMLAEKLGISMADVDGVQGFVRPDEKKSESPWKAERDQQLFKDVCLFVDPMPAEQKLILADLVDLENPNDRAKVAELVNKHGQAISELSEAMKRISNMAPCPMRQLRLLVAVRLEGGQILADEPYDTGVDARRMPTVVKKKDR